MGDAEAVRTPGRKKPKREDRTLLGRLAKMSERVTVGVPRGVVELSPPYLPLTMLDLRVLILHPDTSIKIRDKAWSYLVLKARVERGDWYLLALGAAMPGLRKEALRLAPKTSPADMIEHVHQDLAAEFVIALHRVELGRAHIAARLIDQAAYYAETRFAYDPRWTDFDNAVEAAHSGHGAYQVPPVLRGHPDLVLARLVHATRRASDGHRLTARHVELIARPCFEEDDQGKRKTVEVVAGELGISVPAAKSARARSLKLLVRLIPQHPDVTA
ncbi:MAG: hypothetical protein ACRDT6_19360 [Micromonosporaceae bacterium]